MRFIRDKLHASKGETLIETLVSVLVVALACTIFATMTITSTHLNAAAGAADDLFYAELTAAETQSGSTSSDPVIVSWSGGSQSFSVTRVGADGELKSYQLSVGGGG